MHYLDRRGALYVACMAVVIVLMLLVYWREQFWTLWVSTGYDRRARRSHALCPVARNRHAPRPIAGRPVLSSRKRPSD
jgi:hypothetical protein